MEPFGSLRDESEPFGEGVYGVDESAALFVVLPVLFAFSSFAPQAVNIRKAANNANRCFVRYIEFSCLNLKFGVKSSVARNVSRARGTNFTKLLLRLQSIEKAFNHEIEFSGTFEVGKMRCAFDDFEPRAAYLALHQFGIRRRRQLIFAPD